MKTNANRWKRAGALWAVLVILAGTGAACSRTGEPVTASGTEVTERTQPPTQPSAAAAPAEPDWRLLLVNARNPLPEGFTVELKTLEDGQAVDRRIWPDLCRMLEAAREAGLSPLICSAYRTNAQQQSLFLRKIRRLEAQGLPHQEAREEAARVVAPPGTSEHETGLALDITAQSYPVLEQDQEDTPEQQWLMENAWRFGFILRYPQGKTEITGICYEPWHYRYVGREAAKEIKEKGLCLEEYLSEPETGG